MSVGPSEKMDETNRADKANGTRGENGDGKIACKPFSKVLIDRAIRPPMPTSWLTKVIKWSKKPREIIENLIVYCAN